jgi:hypothetical protein
MPKRANAETRECRTARNAERRESAITALVTLKGRDD